MTDPSEPVVAAPSSAASDATMDPPAGSSNPSAPSAAPGVDVVAALRFPFQARRSVFLSLQLGLSSLLSFFLAVLVGAGMQAITGQPGGFLWFCLMVCLIYGVMFVGPIVMLGWLRAIFDGVRTDRLSDLPDIEWRTHFIGGLGIAARLLLSQPAFFIVSLMCLMFQGAMMGLVEASLPVSDGVARMLRLMVVQFITGIPLLMVMMLGMLQVSELGRRVLSGDWLGLFRWRRAMRTIIAHPVPYLLTSCCVLLGLGVAWMGMMACGVGLFVTLPLGGAVAVHAVAQWDRYLRHHDAAEL